MRTCRRWIRSCQCGTSALCKKEEPLVVTSGPSLGRKRPSKAIGPEPDCRQGNARAKRLRTLTNAATPDRVQFRMNTVSGCRSRVRDGLRPPAIVGLAEARSLGVVLRAEPAVRSGGRG